MTIAKSPRLAFYGDDLTGSTDAMGVLARSGLKTVLFLDVPSREVLKSFRDLDAIGIAGTTRAMKVQDMEQALRPAFEVLRSTGARHIHYKVCSTFDSSAGVGSIGKAIDVGGEVFSQRPIPVLVASPELGRYSVFGNLFARMGIGSENGIFRLDRHPSMSRHPVTPMDESDLPKHLAKQSSKKIGLVDLLTLRAGKAAIDSAVDAATAAGTEILFFDALTADDVEVTGSVIDGLAERAPLFSAGSSGIESALCAHWHKKGALPAVELPARPPADGPLLVCSGSCSPVTAAQIHTALANGFAEVMIDAERVFGGDGNVAECQERVKKNLGQGKSVVLHTGQTQVAPRHDSSALLGTFLGRVAHAAVTAGFVKRVVIAGGDTSGFAGRALGIYAIETIAPLWAGAPLCRAYADDPAIDGLEVNFKGGQVGTPEYFIRAASY